MFREVALISRPPNMNNPRRDSYGFRPRLIGMVPLRVDNGNEEEPCRVAGVIHCLGTAEARRVRTQQQEHTRRLPWQSPEGSQYHKTASGRGRSWMIVLTFWVGLVGREDARVSANSACGLPLRFHKSL